MAHLGLVSVAVLTAKVVFSAPTVCSRKSTLAREIAGEYIEPWKKSWRSMFQIEAVNLVNHVHEAEHSVGFAVSYGGQNL